MDGAARLVIAPEADGFLMYQTDEDRSADEDRSWVIARIESVEEWLDANKEWLAANTDEKEGPTAPRACRQAFKRARKLQRRSPEAEADM